jgi:hypothetical protein
MRVGLLLLGNRAPDLGQLLLRVGQQSLHLVLDFGDTHVSPSAAVRASTSKPAGSCSVCRGDGRTGAA